MYIIKSKTALRHIYKTILMRIVKEEYSLIADNFFSEDFFFNWDIYLEQDAISCRNKMVSKASALQALTLISITRANKS